MQRVPASRRGLASAQEVGPPRQALSASSNWSRWSEPPHNPLLERRRLVPPPHHPAQDLLPLHRHRTIPAANHVANATGKISHPPPRKVAIIGRLLPQRGRHHTLGRRNPPRAERCVWTAPRCKGVLSLSGELSACGRVFGLAFAAGRPQAMMVFVDRRPDKWSNSRFASFLGLGRSRSHRSRHQVQVTRASRPLETIAPLSDDPLVSLPAVG